MPDSRSYTDGVLAERERVLEIIDRWMKRDPKISMEALRIHIRAEIVSGVRGN